MSVNSISPDTLFGGTWNRLESRFLIGADDDTYNNGDTGGETTHTLTLNEIPAHSHKLKDSYKQGVESSSYDSKAFAGNQECSGYNDERYIESTGGGQAHNNMPPYLAVYMWKRTA